MLPGHPQRGDAGGVVHWDRILLTINVGHGFDSGKRVTVSLALGRFPSPLPLAIARCVELFLLVFFPAFKVLYTRGCYLRLLWLFVMLSLAQRMVAMKALLTLCTSNNVQDRLLAEREKA